MRIAPSHVVLPPSSSTSPVAASEPIVSSAWSNPAAAAALLSTVDLLREIEGGIVRNFTDVGVVRGYAADLRSTLEIFEAAQTAISTDGSAENDSFLPLITNAGSGVERAEARLSSKELASTWPIERGDILSAIRRAKAISQNVADQLDPRPDRPRRNG